MSVDESNIEPAATADYEEMRRLLDQANQFALSRSSEPMWTAMDYVYDELRSHLASGNCYVLRNRQQKILATITITDEGELWNKDDNALYFHKLMKSPQCSIQNVGLIFISFTAHEALKHNRKLLRCDTKPSQKQLVNYYLKLSFVIKGSFIYESNGKEGILLEAKATEVIDRIARFHM